jgi:transposase
MNKRITFIGLDVHKDSISAAVAEHHAEPRSLGKIANTPQAIHKLMRRLGPFQNLKVCYEAGPCGYVIYRQLSRMGVACVVVAPSLIPKKPGVRVKTDRKDGVMLARLLRSGDLEPIWVPDADHEALRDLSRAVEAAQGDLMRARHRIRKLLLRQGIRKPDGMNAWTYRHREWLHTVKLLQASQQVVLREMLLTMDQARERRQRLEAELEQAIEFSPLAHLVQAWQCLRGIKVISAIRLAAELGDIRRFTTPRQLMGYVGLVPSERSSGSREWRGSVTKTGNAHVRHILVQAAWHSRHAPSISAELRKRQRGQPERVKAIAWKAQDRLHRRFRRLVGRGKPGQKAVVAVAREMLGFIWAIAQEIPVPEQDQQLDQFSKAA